MSYPNNNCAVIAIHELTGDAHQDIIAGIAAFPDDDGGPAFVRDGVSMSSVSAYLEARGWKELFFEDRPSVPWTCMISVTGHCFAIVEGCIHDRCEGSYDGAQIVSIFVPPTPSKGAGPGGGDRG